MKFKLLFLFVVLGLLGRAQTIYVEGPQTGVLEADTVWVTGDVEVVDSLIVAPGTTVLFDGFYSISVKDEAVFQALGTENEQIVFTVLDTAGFHVYNKGVGGWNGFQLSRAGSVRFDHCLLQYGKAASEEDQHGGALEIIDCEDVELNHCVIRCNFAREHGGAINAENSTVRFHDCSINENKLYSGDNLFYMYGGGARFLKCDVEMTGMEFRNNYGEISIGGALSLDSCSVILDRAVFVDNIGLNGGGMYIMRCNDKECRLSNLLFDGNYSFHFAGGLAFSDASPDVYNILVTNNASGGVSCNGMFFYQYSSPRLTNCILYGNYPLESSSQSDTTQMWIWTFDEYAPEFRNCLIEGNSDYVHGFESIKVFEDILFGDPLFVDAENHDFRLSEWSPCRDAGLNDLPEELLNGLDLVGIRRVSNNRIDIGPYEYSESSVPQFDMPQAFARLLGNPLGSHSALEVELEQAGTVMVKVCSLTGHCLVNKTFDGVMGNNSLGIGEWFDVLDPGIYLIEVIGNDRRCTLKAVR